MLSFKSKDNGKFFTVISNENRILYDNVKVACSFGSRLKGLLGKKELSPGEGLFIAPCTSIHMFFMNFPIDAIFLDNQGQIIWIYHNLGKWRLSRYHTEALGVLEVTAGTAEKHGLKPGMILRFAENP